MPDHPLLFAMTGARTLCGGIATANLNVLHALSEVAGERRLPLRVLSLLESERDRPDFLPPRVEFRGFGGDKWLFAADLLRGARRRATVCFDHVTLALPLLHGAALGLVRTLIFAHGSEAWRRLRPTSRWSFQCAALCLTNSHFTLRKMRERIPRLKAVACPLGLSPQFPLNETLAPARASLAFPAADGEVRRLGQRVLLLVGRMDQREGEKGHRALLAVLPELLPAFPDVQLVFAGPGDDRQQLALLARERRVDAAVFLPGYVAADQLQALYRHCYALVMPSTQEGFGLVYLEAMNYGKPCVGCANDGAEDVIVSGETGFLVHDRDDPRDLLAVLRALLGDPARAEQLGRAGFARLHRHFTARHYQQRIKAQITNIL